MFTMAKKDVAEQYAGSFLGFLWNFIHPAVLITVFWVVFSVGFKVKPMNEVPFVVWLTASFAGWFFFSESLAQIVVVVVQNANLIKNTVFESQILIVVKIMSGFVKHLIFISILFFLVFLNDLPASLVWFQWFYYMFCIVILLLGLGWLVSALNVFIRDVAQVVSVMLQVGFWATPVFWDLKMMPPAVQQILKLNPLYYIVQGYRDTFIYFRPFWESPYMTLYFWAFNGIVFFLGIFVFARLKNHFADVL